MNVVLLPFSILKFWYIEAPVSLFFYFINLNRVFLSLFSVPIMVRTFFRPWKNEYREGFVGFSIFMGMAFKTLLITVDLFMLFFILLFEVIVFMMFLAWPIATFYLPFIRF